MLWAIDVGNTQTVVGRWGNGTCHHVWRLATDKDRTEDEWAVHLKGLCDLVGLPFSADQAVMASVVPALIPIMQKCFSRHLNCEMRVLTNGKEVGIPVTYDPPHAVGSDRIANALGALEKFQPPIIVVDFGTATTFDVIDKDGVYVGGAILPGVRISAEALAQRAAKLPPIALKVPEVAIGRNTVQALESGIMWGYAGSVDSLVTRIQAELGQKAKVIATGGLGAVFVDLCPDVELFDPYLTLEGLRIAWPKLG